MNWGLFDIVGGGAGDGDDGGRGPYGLIARSALWVNVSLGGPGSWGSWTEMLGPQPTDIVIVGCYQQGAGTVNQIGYGPNSGAVTQIGATAGTVTQNGAVITSLALIPKGQRTYMRGMNPGGAGSTATSIAYVRSLSRALRQAAQRATVANLNVFSTGLSTGVANTYGAWVEVADTGLLTAGKRYKVMNVHLPVDDDTVVMQLGLGAGGSQAPHLEFTPPRGSYTPYVDTLVDALAGNRRSGLQVPGGQQVWLRVKNSTGGTNYVAHNPIFVEV